MKKPAATWKKIFTAYITLCVECVYMHTYVYIYIPQNKYETNHLPCREKKKEQKAWTEKIGNFNENLISNQANVK